MMWFLLICIVVFVILVGSTMSSAFRWLARLLASIAVAIMIAVPTGVLLMEGNEDEVAMALLLVVPLSAGLFSLMKPRHQLADFAASPVQGTKAEPSPLKRGRFRRSFPADQIAQVWDRLEDEAPHQAARIAVARRSTEHSRQELRSRHLDLSAHSALVLLEKRIPELIEDELTTASSLPSHVGMKALDELIDLLERFAADCERQVGNHRRMGAPETRLLRQHIERYLDRDGLRSFDS